MAFGREHCTILMNPNAFPCFNRGRARKAFTLLELLIVITIIVILIALLFPSLSTMRERANVLKCMSNMKQLATASFTYAVDNNGALPRNEGWEPVAKSPRGWEPASWLIHYGPTDQSGQGISGTTGLKGIQDGSIFPYVKDERIYLCPSYPKDPAGTLDYKHSYSMMMHVNGIGDIPNMARAARPAAIIMFVDENPPKYGPPGDTIWHDDAYWSCDNYGNRPGTYHLCTRPGTGKCNVVFLDGHGETLNGYPRQNTDITKGPIDQIWWYVQNWANFRDGKPPTAKPAGF
jgi:prepilin-type N-terminal cleavage/methylation domain-containing protein/prepilin-type processing-associated H-X9-DG protein